MKSSAWIVLIFTVALAVLLYTIFFKYLPDVEIEKKAKESSTIIKGIDMTINNETNMSDFEVITPK
ncbi:MAG: hypothetical protein RLY61_954 [Candidatus Parcubacteria bacterium]